MSFVHLHVHSEYSLLDGLSKTDELISAAHADGQPAIAITDHGTPAGGLPLATAAHKLRERLISSGDLAEGDPLPVKPILGIEAYLAIGSRHERHEVNVASDDLVVEDSEGKAVSGTKKKRYEHLTLLARTGEGWKNLLRLHRKSYDTFFYKPRMDYDLLGEHSEGLIALTGCLGGPVSGPLHRGDPDEARANLQRLVDIFGQDNVYVEIMDHEVSGERRTMAGLIGLADEFDLPLVATNDCHYTHDHQAEAHDAWLALQSGRGGEASLRDPKRFRFNGSGYHLRTGEEMHSLFDELTDREMAHDFGVIESNGADPDESDDDEVPLEAAAAERVAAIRQAWSTACRNTVLLAERVDEEVIPEGHQRLPRFPVPEDFTVAATRRNATKNPIRGGKPDDGVEEPLTDSDHYLYARALDGARQKYGVEADDGRTILPAVVRERLRTEFDIVAGLGFSDYFLIVEDVITWARGQGIAVGPGRGSAAGSCLSYCLGIVGIDPIRYDLLFDRFLEPGRVGMPDIDVDFEEARRDEVIAYIADRWGAGMVAKIGTYGVSGSRASLQSAARLLEHPEMARMSTHIPAPGGKALPFDEVLDEDNPAAADFRQAVSELSDAERDVFEEMVALARPMEGAVVNTGIHACGIVLSDEPLIDIVPLRLDTRSKAGSGRAGYPITEWEGGALEGYGLLKMDVLGLRNLDVITRACDSIERMTGERIDPNNLPDPTDTDNPRVQAAWDLISAGRTAGLFQIESQGMTRVCEDVRPNSLEDLSVVIALYRPGPLAAKMPQLYADRKWGRKPVEYTAYTDDPAEQEAIASVLGNTQACLVYQEQLMMLSTVVAGFDAMWRSKLRKAVGKKKRDLMDEAGQKFMADAVREFELPDGTIKPAFRESTAKALWEDFKGSAEYSFNASHSFAYAQLAYITAFLKASWPAAYGAALLSVTKDDEKRLGVLHSLASEGVSVVAPDVNVSQPRTAPVDTESVALGLSEVKGVGDAGRDIVAEREAHGPYSSVGDLVARNPSVTTTTLSALIEAGALDRFGPRRGLFMIHRAAKSRPEMAVPDSDWHPLEEARRQRARLGIVMPDRHPMSQVAEQLSDWVEDNGLLEEDRLPLRHVSQRRDGESVLIFGVVREWVQRVSRAGNLYARFVVEDAHGSVPGVAFSRSIQEAARRGHTVTPGDLLCISGTVSIREMEVRQHDDGTDEGVEAEQAVTERVAEVKARSFMLVDLDQSPIEAGGEPTDLSALLSLYETGGLQLPDDARDLTDPVTPLPQAVPEQPSQDPAPVRTGDEGEGRPGPPARPAPERPTVGAVRHPEKAVPTPSGGRSTTATLERSATGASGSPDSAPPVLPASSPATAADRARAREAAHKLMQGVAGPALLHDPETGSTWMYVDGVIASPEHPEVEEAWRRWGSERQKVATFIKRLVTTGAITPGLYSIIDGSEPDMDVALVVLEELTCRWMVPEGLEDAGGRIDVSALTIAEWVRQTLDSSLDVRKH